MKAKPPQYNLIFAGHEDAKKMAELAHVTWVETVMELESFGALAEAQKSRFGAIDRYARYRAEFHFQYSVSMSPGPTRKGKTGEYVNPRYAAVNRLDEKLMKYDLLFHSWCGGKNAALTLRKSNSKPCAADEFINSVRP